MPFIFERVKRFLPEEILQEEFSHTILHRNLVLMKKPQTNNPGKAAFGPPPGEFHAAKQLYPINTKLLYPINTKLLLRKHGNCTIKRYSAGLIYSCLTIVHMPRVRFPVTPTNLGLYG